MNRAVILVVAIFVVFAGCLSDVEAPGDTPSQTTSSWPTPSPTTSSWEGDDHLAPGISTAGIENPIALMSAHQRALLANGYVINETVRATYDGSPSHRLVVTTTVGPGGEHASQSGTSSGIGSDGAVNVIQNDLWLNTTTMVSRHAESGTTTYQIRPRTYSPEALIWFGGLQQDIQFAAHEYRVTSVDTRNGLRISILNATFDRVGNDGVNDTVSSLTVDENGVIRHATVDVSYGDGTRYQKTYTVNQLGIDAPSKPDWVADVPPSAALSIGLDIGEFSERSVQLIHTHGDAVPAGSLITLETNETVYETTLRAPFGGGERYLWVSTAGTFLASDEAPAVGEARSLGSQITVTVFTPDGLELFSLSIGR